MFPVGGLGSILLCVLGGVIGMQYVIGGLMAL